MNRDNALQAARDQLETSIWGLLSELENSLASLASVPHMNIECPHAIGSVLNSALPAAAQEAGIEKDGLEVKYCRNGQCNKISGHVTSGGETFPVSLELHLSGPRGGTTKSKHQFAFSEPAVCDIERQPSLIDFDVNAPESLLLFVACHLSGTGVAVSRAYLKFADGVDQRMIELYRPAEGASKASADVGPEQGPRGAILKVKRPEGDKKEDGIKANKRGDAASSS